MRGQFKATAHHFVKRAALMSKPGDWKKLMMDLKMRVPKDLKVPAVPPAEKLPIEAQSVISRELRQRYDSMLADPLPDRFTKLLEELAKSEGDK